MTEHTVPLLGAPTASGQACFPDCVHGFPDCVHGFPDCVHGFPAGFPDCVHGAPPLIDVPKGLCDDL